MSEDSVKLELNEVPDGFGFIYGKLHHGDERVDINIMPPVKYWAGDMELKGYEPHPEEWVLYVDGEEIGRVTKREDISGVCAANAAYGVVGLSWASHR